MASLADVFVSVTGDLGPLRAAAADGGAAAGQTAATGFRGKFEAGIQVAAAAAGALMVAGLAGAISRGNTTALLAAQVGAAGPEMAKLGKVSGELYAGGYGESVEAVNEALKAVITNGLAGVKSSEGDIKAVASRVSDLTSLMGEDAGRVSAAIQQMLRTGLAKNAEEAFDILTKATQGGINKSEDLLDTLNEYGTQFRELGLDGPTAMGLISQALKAGARDSDTAADALKEFNIIGQSGAKASSEAFTALGLDAKKMGADIAAGGDRAEGALGATLEKLRSMPASVERTQLAVALFGTKAEDLGDALFAMDLSKAGAEFGEFEGAAKKAGDTLAGSAGAQVESFKRQIEEGLINAMAKAIPVIQEVFGWLQRNRDILGPIAAVIGTVAVVTWAVNAAMGAYAAILTVVQLLHIGDIARWIARTAATVAYFVLLGAIKVATIAWTVVQWLLNAALTANPLGLIVLAIALFVGAIILAWKNSETFRNVVMAVWGAIKVAIGAVVDWFTGVIWPSLKKAYDEIATVVGFVINAVIAYWRFMFAALGAVWDGIKAVFKFGVDAVIGYWNLWKAALQAVWGFVRDNVFNPIMDVITNKIPAAFRRGVDLIQFWWNLLKDFVAAPVRFVVDVIINKGIIGTFNTVAGHLGIAKIPNVSLGFAHGGQLPGPASDVDNMVALGPNGKPLALAGGEWIINARQSAKHGGLLHAINSGMDGYAAGGVLGMLTDPVGWVKDRVGLGGIPGAGILKDILSGAGGKMISGLIEWVKSKISGMFSGSGGAGPGFLPWPSSPGAQRGDSGVWRNIVALIRSTGPLSGAFGNSYRPGDPLWHGSGRAVDWMGFNQDALASFFMARMGNVLELIHRSNSRDYAVTRGRNRGSFSNGLMEAHRNHIHIAMAEGGMVGRVMDSGGWMAPGWNPPTFNGTGKPELVLPSGATVALDRGSIRELAAEIAAALTGGMVSARRLGRQYA